ncbi:MAG: membrane protein insertase YidC [Desulfuromonas sp.]|nr:MAG: membrane protein insertase YidC [Desulfuromonas sp.]
MENKNTIIAIVLITAIWFGYTLFFPPQPPQQQAGTPSVQAEQTSANASDVQLMEESRQKAPEKFSEVTHSKDFSSEETVVDTDVLRLTISNEGGVIRNLEMKKYGLTSAPDSPRVTLVDSPSSFNGTLRLSGHEGFGLSGSAPYSFQNTARELVLQQDQQEEVVLAAKLEGGLEVVRVYRFTGGHYDIETSVQLFNRGSQPLSGRAVLSLVNGWSEDQKGSMYEFAGPSVFAEESLNQEDVDDLGVDGVSFSKDVLWTAFEEKYFASILVPASGFSRIRLLQDGPRVENQILSDDLVLNPGESTELNFTFFAGPKRVDLLTSVGQRIDELVDFGWFAFISHPLLIALKFFYGYIGNYGIAIILLTFLIKMLFWPLTQKSYTSMKSMQKLQPQMQKLREKYKNDRERMNRELMELYKTHRVNPLGGCLPMLIQIPVFFALYKVLLFSIELRHAPFMLWITDLSAKDPYYVTPLIMGASMFVQQKMMPTQMDPNQARIMMMMPVIFTFMFLNFPSGLVIYWLVNNLLTIGQQYLINRKGAEAT